MSAAISIPDRDAPGKKKQSPLTDFVKRFLTREERLLVTLWYCEELNSHEISIILGRSVQEVQATHERIVRRVRRELLATDTGRIQVA